MRQNRLNKKKHSEKNSFRLSAFFSHRIVRERGQGDEKLTAEAVDNPAIRQNIFPAQRNVELASRPRDSDLRNPNEDNGDFAEKERKKKNRRGKK